MIPDFILSETWEAFLEMRRLKGSRAPLTDFAKKRVIAKLTEFHRQGYDANFILAETVERGWTSVFLTADTPRRELTAEDKANIERVQTMLKGSIRRVS